MSAEKIRKKKDRAEDGSLIYRVSIWREYEFVPDYRFRWFKQEIGCVQMVSAKKWQATSDWGRVIAESSSYRGALWSLVNHFLWDADEKKYVSHDQSAFNLQVKALRQPANGSSEHKEVKPCEAKRIPRHRHHLSLMGSDVIPLVELIALDPYD